MRSKYQVRHGFAEAPLNITVVERKKLMARAREAIDYEKDSPRLRRLDRFLSRLRDEGIRIDQRRRTCG
jgi:hypothetical protein